MPTGPRRRSRPLYAEIARAPERPTLPMRRCRGVRSERAALPAVTAWIPSVDRRLRDLPRCPARSLKRARSSPFDFAAVRWRRTPSSLRSPGPDASLPGAAISPPSSPSLVAMGRRRFLTVRRLLDVPPTITARRPAGRPSPMKSRAMTTTSRQRSGNMVSMPSATARRLEHDGSISASSQTTAPRPHAARVRRYRTRGPNR